MKITQQNTYFESLEKLYAKYTEAGKPKHLGERLDKLYRKAQDAEHELARRELTEAHKRHDHKRIEELGDRIKNYRRFTRLDNE